MDRNTEDRFASLAGLKLLEGTTTADEQDWEELLGKHPQLMARWQKIQQMDQLLKNLPEDVRSAVHTRLDQKKRSPKRFFLPGAALAALVLFAFYFTGRKNETVPPVQLVRFEQTAGNCLAAGKALQPGIDLTGADLAAPAFCVLGIAGENSFHLTLAAGTRLRIGQTNGIHIVLDQGQVLLEEKDRPENRKTSLTIGDVRATLTGTRLAGRVEGHRAHFQVLEGEVRLQQSLLNLTSTASIETKREALEDILGSSEIMLVANQESTLELGNLREKRRLLQEIHLLLERSADLEQIKAWKELLAPAAQGMLSQAEPPRIQKISATERESIARRFPGTGNPVLPRTAEKNLYIHLSDGSIIAGEILTTDPDYRIRTRDGRLLSIPSDSVVRITSDP